MAQPIDFVPEAPVTAYVALGANLGDAGETLEKAIEAIGEIPGTEVTARSSFYRTAPVDASGPDYTNAVVRVETELPARSLWRFLARIELAFGRERPAGVYHAPRTLDLDVLLYGDTISTDPEVTLPHPRMHERAFVLVPLTEIAPMIRIPGLCSAKEALSHITDQPIEKI